MAMGYGLWPMAYGAMATSVHAWDGNPKKKRKTAKVPALVAPTLAQELRNRSKPGRIIPISTMSASELRNRRTPAPGRTPAPAAPAAPLAKPTPKVPALVAGAPLPPKPPAPPPTAPLAAPPMAPLRAAVEPLVKLSPAVKKLYPPVPLFTCPVAGAKHGGLIADLFGQSIRKAKAAVSFASLTPGTPVGHGCVHGHFAAAMTMSPPSYMCYSHWHAGMHVHSHSHCHVHSHRYCYVHSRGPKPLPCTQR